MGGVAPGEDRAVVFFAVCSCVGGGGEFGGWGEVVEELVGGRVV